MGWSEDQALAADVNAIMVGMAGKWAMLTAIFGSSDEQTTAAPAPKVSERKMTPELFDALF